MTLRDLLRPVIPVAKPNPGEKSEQTFPGHSWPSISNYNSVVLIKLLGKRRRMNPVLQERYWDYGFAAERRAGVWRSRSCLTRRANGGIVLAIAVAGFYVSRLCGCVVVSGCTRGAECPCQLPIRDLHLFRGHP